MTKFELYTKIKEDYSRESTSEAEAEYINAVVALCDTELKSLARATERAAEKRAEKNAANEPLIAQITAMVENGPVTASEVAEALQVKVQKASALLRSMGLAVSEIKVPKKGTVKAYSKA